MTIKSYDVDFRRQASFESLCRYFLEAAWNHAEALGVGFNQLAAQNKVWVLSRLLFRVERYPNWCEEVVLRTWPRERESVFALRDFEFVDGQGHRSAGGSSAWVVLDINSRRPQRLDKMLAAIKTHDARATERNPEKLETDEVATTVTETVVQAKYSDEDLNGHVNSARYIRWLLDAYPLEWHRNHVAAQVEMNYLGEVRGGETIRVRTQQPGPLRFLHGMFKAEGQEACRARVDWRPQ